MRHLIFHLIHFCFYRTIILQSSFFYSDLIKALFASISFIIHFIEPLFIHYSVFIHTSSRHYSYLTSLFFTSYLCIVGSCHIQVSPTCRKRRTTAATRSHGRRGTKRTRVSSEDNSDSDALDDEDSDDDSEELRAREKEEDADFVLHGPRLGSRRPKKRAKPAAKKKGKPPTKTRPRHASNTRAKPKPAAYCSFMHSFIKPLFFGYSVFIHISSRHYLNLFSFYPSLHQTIIYLLF